MAVLRVQQCLQSFARHTPCNKKTSDGFRTDGFRDIRFRDLCINLFLRYLVQAVGQCRNHVSPRDKDPFLYLANQKYALVYYLSVGDQVQRARDFELVRA